MRACLAILSPFRVVSIITLLAFTALAPALGQNRKELEKKQEQLRKDIDFTNKILEETRHNKSMSLNHLVALNKKIGMREELIASLNNEVRILQDQLDETTSVITSLEKDVSKLKEDYARMIYYAYKNQSAYQRLMFIFSSADFNQAYKRLRYLQQYSDYRKKQKETIDKTQTTLTARRTELELKKATKTSLLSSVQSEKIMLYSEKTEQVQAVNSLQEKEKELRAELSEKKKAEDRLNKAIEDIIRREIELARRNAEKENKPVAKESFVLTPEAQKLSDDFTGNKGKLPWPVEQGVITETFGVHQHPVLKNIETNNLGVDIGTRKGAVARAVFDGTVLGVLVIVSGKAVMVRHGEYFTIYSNLEEVYVKTGDKVTTKQALGTIHTNEEDSKTELNFQVWKGTQKQNPELWLYKNR